MTTESKASSFLGALGWPRHSLHGLHREVKEVLLGGSLPVWDTGCRAVLRKVQEPRGCAARAWVWVCLGAALLMSFVSTRANSVTWNPHKMMGVPLQCSALLVREEVCLSRPSEAGVGKGQREKVISKEETS